MSADKDVTIPPVTFFAKRRKFYPRAVSGVYRHRKTLLQTLCLAIYYLTPFLRWDRGPNAPDQAILIDMVHRRLYWFDIEIWPQEVYYLTGILILAAVTLFAVTSLLGRVWCGYFCFQTVWTDLFIWVEKVMQGDSAVRQKLDASPWSLNKIWRKAGTHLGWLSIAFFTGGAYILYFNDAPTLMHNLFSGQGLTTTQLAFVFGLTGSTYLMAGFAREQVCTYMCPYARFQSAMFDEDTLIIGYDTMRGEPRGKHKKGDSWDNKGHCIDCTQCVQVCPMGIDIRDGLQIQCIACGLCIDACDSVMEKMDLPKGLIRYDTERRMKEGGDQQELIRHLIRPRTMWYGLILALALSVMFYGIVSRTTLDLNVFHDRNPLFVRLSSGEIRNGYEIKILNKTLDEVHYQLAIEELPNAQITVEGAGKQDIHDLIVPPDSVGHFRLYVTAPEHDHENNLINFVITDPKTATVAKRQSIFITRTED